MLLCKAVVVSVLLRVRGACWEGIPGRWISREEPLYLVEASLLPWGRGPCATDDRGSETAEAKISWLGGRLGRRSSAEDGRVAPKLVTGIPEAVDMEIPEVPTLLSGMWLGGCVHAAAGLAAARGNGKRH